MPAAPVALALAHLGLMGKGGLHVWPLGHAEALQRLKDLRWGPGRLRPCGSFCGLQGTEGGVECSLEVRQAFAFLPVPAETGAQA